MRTHWRGRMGLAREPALASTLASSAIAEIRQLAEAGVPEAIFLMGSAYDEGLGVTADPREAAVWFRRAADRGHILAQHSLGNAYADGRGLAQEDATAIYWWRKAADRGDTVPQFRLGQIAMTRRSKPAKSGRRPTCRLRPHGFSRSCAIKRVTNR